MSEGTGQRLAILAGVSQFVLGCLIVAAYFVPTIIAALRRHPNWQGILLVNLLLGWTYVGWIGALVWSLYHKRAPTPAFDSFDHDRI